MIRVAVTFVAWSLLGAAVSAEVLRIDGETVGASLPWTDRLFDEVEGPLLRYPTNVGSLPYTGILMVNAESSSASFEVSVYPCVAGGTYCTMDVDLVTGNLQEVPTTYRLARNLFEGIVRNDAVALVIDYRSPFQPGEGVTSFQLSLEKITGVGEWRWSLGPADVCFEDVCAPSLPANEASGTIAGFIIVAEPGSLALAIWGAVAGLIGSDRLMHVIRPNR